MKVTIKLSMWDYIEVETTTLKKELPSGNSYFRRAEEDKWVKFCKKHNFHPIHDAHGKIYDLYLELCAEGLV